MRLLDDVDVLDIIDAGGGTSNLVFFGGGEADLQQFPFERRRVLVEDGEFPAEHTVAVSSLFAGVDVDHRVQGDDVFDVGHDDGQVNGVGTHRIVLC